MALDLEPLPDWTSQLKQISPAQRPAQPQLTVGLPADLPGGAHQLPGHQVVPELPREACGKPTQN